MLVAVYTPLSMFVRVLLLPECTEQKDGTYMLVRYQSVESILHKNGTNPLVNLA
jgi:hypothetical protein